MTHTGADLVGEMSKLRNELADAVSDLWTRGKVKANAEREYRVALAKMLLIYRDAGLPVTIIGDVCRGEPKIAQLKFERDLSETEYFCCIELVNSIKLQIRIMESQISREWGMSK